MGANMDREIMPIIERESNAVASGYFVSHMKYEICHMPYFIFLSHLFLSAGP